MRVNVINFALERLNKNLINRGNVFSPIEVEAKTDQFLSANLLSLLPSDFKTIFAEVHNKEGKSFVRVVYSELKKSMGLSGLAPKEIVFKELSDGINAEYDDLYNVIYYSPKALKENSKAKQVGTIAHELTHCKQSCDLIMNNAIGVDGYAQALAERKISKQRQDISDIKFQKAYMAAKKQGKNGQFIMNLVNIKKEYFTPLLKQSFANVDRLPKVKADSKSAFYLRNNLLSLSCYSKSRVYDFSLVEHFREKQAYEVGSKYENYYKICENLLKK